MIAELHYEYDYQQFFVLVLIQLLVENSSKKEEQEVRLSLF